MSTVSVSGGGADDHRADGPVKQFLCCVKTIPFNQHGFWYLLQVPDLERCGFVELLGSDISWWFLVFFITSLYN